MLYSLKISEVGFDSVHYVEAVVSRVPTSVITAGVYQVARCGWQSAYLCYYCSCISGSKVWLAERLPLLLLQLYIR